MVEVTGCDPGLTLEDVVLLPCSLLDPPIRGKMQRYAVEWRNVDFSQVIIALVVEETSVFRQMNLFTGCLNVSLMSLPAPWPSEMDAKEAKLWSSLAKI